jgi:hypothetical protein
MKGLKVSLPPIKKDSKRTLYLMQKYSNLKLMDLISKRVQETRFSQAMRKLNSRQQHKNH